MFGIIARPAPVRSAAARKAEPTVSVVIPCRNEAGHIAPLVASLPELPAGHRVPLRRGPLDRRHRGRDPSAQSPSTRELPLRFFQQPGKGKGDAVRLRLRAGARATCC